jgi:hypothetical protein
LKNREALSSHVRLAHPVAPAIKELPCHLDVGQIERIVGAKGEMKAGVLKFTLGRPRRPRYMHSLRRLEIDATMGYNTWASLQGTEERAAICGDFAMLELEVAPIIRELRAGGIEVVAAP